MSNEASASLQKKNRPISAKQRERDEAIAQLRHYLKPGVTVWTVLLHVNASGMSRLLDLYIIKDNQPYRLTWSTATALGWPYSRKQEALRIDGCGMDMGHHAVYCLSHVVLGDGYALAHRWL